MQGAISSENTEESQTFFDYIKDTIAKSCSPQDFLDVAYISVPKQKSEVKERIQTNFEKYKGNYLVVMLFFIFIFLVLNPATIPLICLWAVFFYIFKKGDQQVLNIRNFTIRKDYVFKGCIVATVLMLLILYNVVFSLMASTCFFTIVCLTHMILFYDNEELENEV